MPSHEKGLRFDDPAIGVDWGITDINAVNLSEKDTKAPLFSEAEYNFTFK